MRDHSFCNFLVPEKTFFITEKKADFVVSGPRGTGIILVLIVLFNQHQKTFR
jgi:hypothetical protein